MRRFGMAASHAAESHRTSNDWISWVKITSESILWRVNAEE
jgi:hypothetical protein